MRSEALHEVWIPKEDGGRVIKLLNSTMLHLAQVKGKRKDLLSEFSVSK